MILPITNILRFLSHHFSFKLYVGGSRGVTQNQQFDFNGILLLVFYTFTPLTTTILNLTWSIQWLKTILLLCDLFS
jgi:hypothetical protein